MSASIWSPDDTIPSEAPPDYVYKRIWIDVSAGQTLVDFASTDPTFVYTPGLQSLEVGIDGGMPLQPGVDYIETTTQSITLLATPTDAGRLYAAVGRPINVSPFGINASLVPYTFPNGIVRAVQDLATFNGTDGIGYTASGAGALTETLQAFLRKTVYADSYATVQQAIDSNSGQNTEVIFSEGAEYPVSGLTWNGPGRLVLRGEAGSFLRFNATSGNLITVGGGSFLAQDLQIYHPTYGAVTSGHFFSFENCQAELQNIRFFNGANLAIWGQGCANCGARNIYAAAPSANGFTVDVSPTLVGQQYGIIVFDDLRFQGNALNTGIGLNFVSGDTIITSNSNIAGFFLPIKLETSASRSYLANIFFTNVFADGAGGPAITQPGWFIDGTANYLFRVFLANCWSSAMGSHGLYSKNVKVLNIVGMENIQNVGHGFLLDTGSETVLIDDCIVSGNSRGSPGTNHGIAALAGSNKLRITNNVVGPTYNATDASQFDTQGFGIIIADASTTRYTIEGNDVTGNLTAQIGDFGGATGTNKKIYGNTGYNPTAPAAATVGASPWTYTNNTGAPIVLAIYGGTVSSIVANGRTIAAATNAQAIIPQGKTAVVTYTVAPSAEVSGLI